MRSKHDAERLELLSSPFIDDTKKDEKVATDVGAGAVAGDESDLSVSSSPKKHLKAHLQSPMRLRERLAYLFGGRNSVDEHLKSIADAEERVITEPSMDTVKSAETRGSSLINEQLTYYNTLRNQHIEDVEEPEIDENKVPVGSLPPAKYLLSIYPNQLDYFEKGQDMIKNNIKDYTLVNKWNLWTDKPVMSQLSRPGTSNSTTYVFGEHAQRRKLHLDHSIETKIRLNETILSYKTQLKLSYACLQVHIFKDGIKPRRQSCESGGIIALQVPLSKGYKLWKNILRLTLDDQFHHHEDPTIYSIKNMICGISFIVKETATKEHSRVVLLKLWLQPVPPAHAIQKQTTAALCHMLHDNFEQELQHSVKLAKYVDHTTGKVFQVFK